MAKLDWYGIHYLELDKNGVAQPLTTAQMGIYQSNYFYEQLDNDRIFDTRKPYVGIYNTDGFNNINNQKLGYLYIIGATCGTGMLAVKLAFKAVGNGLSFLFEIKNAHKCEAINAVGQNNRQLIKDLRVYLTYKHQKHGVMFHRSPFDSYPTDTVVAQWVNATDDKAYIDQQNAKYKQLFEGTNRSVFYTMQQEREQLTAAFDAYMVRYRQTLDDMLKIDIQQSDADRDARMVVLRNALMANTQGVVFTNNL
jgi:hypothetical protein